MRNLVPQLILEQFATGELSGRFQATALFVDISGFSAITDALMQHGQYGAEVLATVMNSIFDPLVRSVYEQGGFVGGFAGDAFTAIFPDSPLHALAAGWTIQQHMGSHADYDTPYGRFSVFAKVGAAAGEVAWGIVTSEVVSEPAITSRERPSTAAPRPKRRPAPGMSCWTPLSTNSFTIA